MRKSPDQIAADEETFRAEVKSKMAPEKLAFEEELWKAFQAVMGGGSN
jgi:hypothetical protein